MKVLTQDKLLADIIALGPVTDYYHGSPDRAVLHRIHVMLQTALNDQRPSSMYHQGLDYATAVTQQYYTTTKKPIDLTPIIEALEVYLGIRKPKPEYEKRPNLYIVVEDGEIFEGNEEQWAECFFSDVTEEAVREFCEENGWSVTVMRTG